MRVGLHSGFQNTYDDVSDHEIYRRCLDMMCTLEDLGWEMVWATEHHFNQRYSMTPDNIMLLTHYAAKMPNITVGTGAVILPWNNPLRVAEKITVLDHLTNGRVVFGMGRGLAKKEYDGFMVDMNESRGRYDEAAAMIIEGLETGVVQSDGPYYRQDPTEIHPAPFKSFKDRMFAVGMSPPSVVAAAELGVGLMMFIQSQPQEMLPMLESYRETFREKHGREASQPPVLGGQVYCHADADVARERAMLHMGIHYQDIVSHYNMADDHFSKTTGYDSYAANAKQIQEAGLEAAARKHVESNFFGTPDQILEQARNLWETVGPYELQLNPGPMGGMPMEMVEESLRLLSKEALPELKKMGVTTSTSASPVAVEAG